MYVENGSTAKLECKITKSVQLLSYVFWFYKNQRVLESINDNVQISMTQDKDNQETIATLILNNVDKNKIGPYTCAPSNMNNVTINVHIVDGMYKISLYLVFKKNQY